MPGGGAREKLPGTVTSTPPALSWVEPIPTDSAIVEGRGCALAGTAQRRSERVLVDLPILVSGESADHGAFQEETFTVTVSAHGALVMLATKVTIGQKVVLTNPANHGRREARVA